MYRVESGIDPCTRSCNSCEWVVMLIERGDRMDGDTKDRESGGEDGWFVD